VVQREEGGLAWASGAAQDPTIDTIARSGPIVALSHRGHGG